MTSVSKGTKELGRRCAFALADVRDELTGPERGKPIEVLLDAALTLASIHNEPVTEPVRRAFRRGLRDEGWRFQKPEGCFYPSTYQRPRRWRQGPNAFLGCVTACGKCGAGTVYLYAEGQGPETAIGCHRCGWRVYPAVNGAAGADRVAGAGVLAGSRDGWVHLDPLKRLYGPPSAKSPALGREVHKSPMNVTKPATSGGIYRHPWCCVGD